MKKIDQASALSEELSRQELFDLHTHYESVVKDMLDLCFQYLNFYTGLLVAILAATLTGFLSFQPDDTRFLALLLGPLLTVFLANLGYANVKVFYSRYIQAWVATINIESMLGLRYSSFLFQGKYSPIYRSKMGGFLPMIERTSIESTLNRAKQEQWAAEKVVTELLRVGDTRRNARNTFIGFICANIILAGIIVFAAFHQ
jgi:hypothetical protein